jgi:hypothetical protein
MKKLFAVMSMVLLLLSAGASRCFGQDPSLQDLAFNLNGTFDDAGNDLGAAINAIPGASLDLSGLAVDGSIPPLLTGLGTIQLTYNPGTAGNYFFDVLSQVKVGTPGYNEFMNTGGTLAAGESYEAGFVPGCTQTTTGACAGQSLGDANLPAAQVYTDVDGATLAGLANTNTLPETTGSNYLETCLTEPGCNGYGVVALGESFTLTAAQEEVLYFNGSYTPPPAGTFYIEQTNPDDGLNGGNATEIYYTMTTSPETVCTQDCGQTPVIPEPSSWILLATGLIGFGMMRLRREIVQA